MFDGGRPRPAIEAAVSRQAIPPPQLPFPKQHDKHVQHADGHEQNDENPQNRPERLGDWDERREHLCAVEHDAEERHEQDDADDGLGSGRCAGPIGSVARPQASQMA